MPLKAKTNRRAVEIIASEKGGFAVVMAISLVILVSVLAFVLDVGYFTRTAGRYQACADAAARAGAENLCCGRIEERATTVALAANVLLPEDALTITAGFYDAYGLYEDFDTYRNFAPAESDDFPEEEYPNAVMVAIENSVDSLTGLNAAKTVKARSVAYLPGVDMVSGKSFFSKYGGGNIAFHQGRIYSAKTGRLYGTEADDNILIGAKDGVKIYRKNYLGWDEFRNRPVYSGSTVRLPDEMPASGLIERYFPAEEGRDLLGDYVGKMKQRADVVYTTGDQSPATPFYGACENDAGTELYCFFDLTGEREAHEIIYFDVPEDDTRQVIAFITATPCYSDKLSRSSTSLNSPMPPGDCSVSDKTPFGKTVENVTFVSNASIYIPRQDAPGISLGGRDGGQVNFVSGEDIFFSSRFNDLNGVAFFSRSFYFSFGGKSDGTVDGNYHPPARNYMRAVTSDGSIIFGRYDTGTGFDAYDFYLKFGPPCPRVFPVAMGRLD
ncbi:MAG: hypothetical protein HUN04_14885 [Desulfobacter sp.]|nr:MAG: hypothetical protein HUN04_14885 [Desulfobacter sp.]